MKNRQSILKMDSPTTKTNSIDKANADTQLRRF